MTDRIKQLEGAIFDLSVHLAQVKSKDPLIWGKRGLDELDGLIESAERARELLQKQS